MIQENDNRLQLLLQIAAMAITLATAAAVTFVKNELAETRIQIMEKISAATHELVHRHEFDALERRLTNIENRRPSP